MEAPSRECLPASLDDKYTNQSANANSYEAVCASCSVCFRSFLPRVWRGPVMTRYRPEYVAPAIDSPRAVAGAQMLLSGAVSVDKFAPEWLSRQYCLSVDQAGHMLALEKQRRAAR